MGGEKGERQAVLMVACLDALVVAAKAELMVARTA